MALLHTSAGLCAFPARHAGSSLASCSILRQRSVGTTEAQTGPAKADPRPQCSATLLKSGNSAPASAYTPFQISATDNLYEMLRESTIPCLLQLQNALRCEVLSYLLQLPLRPSPYCSSSPAAVDNSRENGHNCSSGPLARRHFSQQLYLCEGTCRVR